MDQLRKGVVPWQKPWDARVSMPRNLVSQKEYRGINVLLLLSLAYKSPFWLTYRQVNQLGGKVKRGEKACPVVFWKRYTFEEKDTKMQMEVPFLRYYYVFNLAQCEGLTAEPEMPVVSTPGDPLQAAKDIAIKMPQPPAIKHGKVKACYSPRDDQVSLPSPPQFDKPADYYATLFHELVHATGHETRLKRKAIMEGGVFGSDSYGKEELLAEIGASFLCGRAGILDRTFNNSAAYIGSWLKQLQNDTKLIVQAAACAQRATDFILNAGGQSVMPDKQSVEKLIQGVAAARAA
jgi:antirestriction protein ArdC